MLPNTFSHIPPLLTFEVFENHTDNMDTPVISVNFVLQYGKDFETHQYSNVQLLITILRGFFLHNFWISVI